VSRRSWASRRLLAVSALAALVTALLPGGGALAAQPGLNAAAPKAPSAVPDLVTSAPAGCNTSQPAGYARCFAIVRTPSSKTITPDVSGPPSGALGPVQIQSAYDLPSAGGGQTVAIVDAYGDSDAESDLAAFRSQYELPACTTANGCFRKVDQTGGTNYPADDSDWGVETSLDLDAVSSACPNCNILLVEADDNSNGNLEAAVDEAVALGAKFVSNSYGGSEYSGEQTDDQAYNHPGVVVTASAGDDGYGVSYPAASPYVTAVGGSTLTQDSSVARGWDETVWGSSGGNEGTGSGCSADEPQPSFQQDVPQLDAACQNRADDDVAADADPVSGLAVYDSLGYGGWLQVGGTSLASPLIAATYALAGTPIAGTYPNSYPYLDPSRSSDLFDVTSGADGPCGNVLCTAGPGWDGPTGLGTPDGVRAFLGGPEGQISGAVTDAATGDPIAGATVTADPGDYVTRTNSSGDYELSLAAGTSYALSVADYGYQTGTQSGVSVSAGATTTENVALTAAPSGTLSGVVTDGSGHGWPLHAEITIPGYPGGGVWTSPYTGAFSVTLPQGSYAASVSTDYPGYQPKQVQVTVGSGATAENVSLDADLSACAAPGYGPSGLTQDFSGWSGGSGRDGWSVSGTPGGWRFGQPGNLTPPPGGDDDFALAGSGSSASHVDATLTSPAADLSGQSAPVLTFDSAYYTAAGQEASVQVSTNGGHTWSSVWHQTSSDAVGTVTIPLRSAAHHNDVRVRFSYSGRDGWYWAVDNVLLGTAGCVAQRGGLVAGVVTDGSSGSTLNGAQVTSPAIGQPQGWPAGVSLASADPALPGGFYWLFEPATGSQKFTVTDSGYASAAGAVTVAGGQVTRRDWSLSPQAGASAATAAGRASAVTTAATGPGGADSPSGATSPGATAAAGGAAASQASGTVDVPGLHAATDTVTLPTGDQLTLTSAAAGRYSITTGRLAPRPNGPTPPITVTGSSGPNEAGTIYAVPADAEPLIAAGYLDRGLFSVTWLAAHEGPAGTGTLPVVVRYRSAAALASAAALPGAARATAPPHVPDAVTYDVSLARAGAFWAALTGTTAAAPSWPAAAPGLADGITGAWLAGDPAPAGPGQADPAQGGQPTYTVTETIEAPDDAQVQVAASCDGPLRDTLSFCLGGAPELLGVAGPAVGQDIPSDGISCAVTSASLDACTSFAVTYTVPAGVYSSSDSWADFTLNDQDQLVDLTVPQFTVTGDSAFTVNLNDAQHVTVATPEPTDTAQASNGAVMDYRALPGGTMYYSFVLSTYGYHSYWAVPSSPVTLGTFHFSSAFALGRPAVTMTVAGHQQLTLDPWYQSDTNSAWDPFYGSVRFSGRHTFQLADVGFGSAQDFAGQNVRGKLVLMRPNASGGDDPSDGCPYVLPYSVQLENALQAGAAGVILDATGTNPGSTYSGIDCEIPLETNPGSPYPTVDIPAVSIPASEAAALRALLHSGTVSMTVNDAGPSPYWYYLKFDQEGYIPGSLHYTVAGQDLAAVSDRYHTAQPGAVYSSLVVWEPDETGVGGVVAPVPAPANRRDYIGPVSPGLIYDQQNGTYSPELYTGTAVYSGARGEVLDQRGLTLSQNWDELPLVPGAAIAPSEDGQQLPDLWPFSRMICSGCRVGNVFYPAAQDASGAFPESYNGVEGTSTDGLHLYSGGSEVPPTPVDGVAAFTLPAAGASYRLVMAGADDQGATDNMQTTWDFTSSAPAADQTPPGTDCFGTLFGSTAPCQAAPLVFLRYDAGLSLDDTVTPGEHQLRVTAYHQATDAPPVTSLRVWMSTDGGTTWQPARVTGGRDGDYTVAYSVPSSLPAGTGISLKAQATDAAGDDVTQVINNAYGVTAADAG
jgi:hypothetical protein